MDLRLASENKKLTGLLTLTGGEGREVGRLLRRERSSLTIRERAIATRKKKLSDH